MALYTRLRQELDIRKSDAYTDATAPTEADYETNPANLEDDMNVLRSAVHTLLKNRAGNWWDDLLTPSTFESGAERGVNDLNQDVHDFEHKRVLRDLIGIVDIAIDAAVKATETMDATGGDFANGETFTIGTRVYTMETPFTDTVDYILIEAAATDTLDNIIDAILSGATEGTKFGTGTVVNADVTAAAGAGDTIDFEALVAGTQGNGIALAETSTNVIWTGAAVFLSGGAGDLVILAAGEIPSVTTAAVGAVTTLGLPVIDAAIFGVAELGEVSGGSPIRPKSLWQVVDSDTRDPLQDSDARKIYALAQTEIDTDGHTINDSDQQIQLSFVRLVDEGNDLELVDPDKINSGAGFSVNFHATERTFMLNLNEEDFLRGARLDDAPSALTVDRQAVYDNQGTTPVDQTTNAILDLEGAGLYWEIRDDLEATLVRITEGSAGGTSTWLIGSDVDNYDNNAQDNDFAQGAAFGTSGTEIAVNETAGVISRAANLIIRASGSGELYLDDSNQPGSWAQTDGIKLSETATEWSDWETAFGGEVSIMNAVVQAMLNAQDPTLTWHEVTADAAANVDVSGPSGANNLEVDLPDLDTGTFTANHWLFYNGRLMRPGADLNADYDYYPGTSLTPDADIRFEEKIKDGDVIAAVVWPNS